MKKLANAQKTSHRGMHRRVVIQDGRCGYYQARDEVIRQAINDEAEQDRD